MTFRARGRFPCLFAGSSYHTIPFNVRTPPIEDQGNPREREGVFKVISEGVAMSVPLISRKHLPFSEGGNASAL